MSLFIQTRAPFRSLEKRFRLAQFVCLFLGPTPVPALSLLDDLLEILVAFVGELARGMRSSTRRMSLSNSFLLLIVMAVSSASSHGGLVLSFRGLTTAGQRERDRQQPGRSEPAAARSALMPCQWPSLSRRPH